MEAAGLMTDAGRRAIEVAKANGWWTISDPVEDLIEPPELAAALDADCPPLAPRGTASRRAPASMMLGGWSARAGRHPAHADRHDRRQGGGRRTRQG